MLKDAMTGTPRLRSAYPSTPISSQKHTEQHGPYPGPQKLQSPLAPVNSASTYVAKPAIPFSVIDAPSQRLYVFIFYAGLSLWRISDYLGLVSDEAESFWLFLKWLAIDSIFLYGLPEFQIPWLQWSSSTTALLVILHTLLNALVMFRIPVCLTISICYKDTVLTTVQIPITTWLLTFTKAFYDRELAVSERSVKPASILHNSSLILGKQIIHILPEGSVHFLLDD